MMKIWDQYLYLARVRPDERFKAGTCIFSSKVLAQDIEKKDRAVNPAFSVRLSHFHGGVRTCIFFHMYYPLIIENLRTEKGTGGIYGKISRISFLVLTKKSGNMAFLKRSI